MSMIVLVLLLLISSSSSSMMFKDLNVGITGANRGIGLGLCRRLVEEGTNVIAFARSPYSQELIDLSSNSKCLIIELDVSSSSSHSNALKTLTDKGVNHLDLVIANAGIASKNHPVDPVMMCSEDDMMDLYRTNVIGTMFTLQSFAPMIRDKGICMVMSSRLASIEQCVGLGGYLSYRCSKAALNMLAQTFSEDPEMKKRGIKTLCMHPGWVQTDMGGRGGRKAQVEILESVNGITNVLAVAIKLQQSSSSSSADSISIRKEVIEFSDKFLSNNLVFTGYDFELLPF